MTLSENRLLVLLLVSNGQSTEAVNQMLTACFNRPATAELAYSKAEYVECIKTQKYDVILADHTPPGISAQEVVELAASICPGTPVVFAGGANGYTKAARLCSGIMLKKSAVTIERQESQFRDLRDWLLHLAENFVNISLDKLDGSIESALGMTGNHFDLEFASVWRFEAENRPAQMYAWHRAGCRFDEAIRLKLPPFNAPEMLIHSRFTEPVLLKAVLAQPQKRLLGEIGDDTGIRTAYLFPLLFEGEVCGGLGFYTSKAAVGWDESIKLAGQLLSALLINAMKRREQETTLNETNENIRLIMDSANDGIALYDAHGTLLSMNAEFYRRKRSIAGDPIGKNMLELMPEEIYGDLARRRLAKLNECITTGKPVFFEDERDGSCYWNRYYPVFKQGEIAAVALFSTDISDRKKAEEEARRNAQLEAEARTMREKEKEYLEILDGSTEAAWIRDFKSGAWDCSSKWLKRIGATDVKPQNLKRFMESLVHPDDLQRAKAQFNMFFSNKTEKFSASYRIKTQNDGYIWVIDRGKIVYDKHGEPAKAYGITTDITERRKIHIALIKQEELFKRAFHHNPAALSIIRCSDNRIIEVNDAYLRALGYSWDEVIGRTSKELNLVPNQTRRDRRIAIALQEGSLSNQEAEFCTSDGNILRVLLSLVALEINNQKHMLVMFVDITERIKMERALKENEALLRTIIEGTNDPVYLKDRNSRILMANKNVCEVWGLPLEKILGKNELEFVSDAAKPSAETIINLDKRVMDSDTAETVEVVIQSCTGPKTFLATKTPWHDADGNVIGLIGVSHDITERKAMEQQLIKQAEELKTADANKNRFLSMLSHELRNPLAVIQAGLSVLSMTDEPERIKRTTQLLRCQADNLYRLVDDLLDVTRIIHNRIEVKKQIIDICETVCAVAEGQAAVFNEKQVKLVSEISEAELQVNADPVRIAQAIENLLHNALKFTAAGGEVRLLVYKEKKQVVISVSDDGKGIEPEFLPYVFEPFTQADHTLDRKDGGLGLGLSIVKGIAELHGGSVSAKSPGLGKGSEFTIRLPAAC